MASTNSTSSGPPPPNGKTSNTSRITTPMLRSSSQYRARCQPRVFDEASWSSRQPVSGGNGTSDSTAIPMDSTPAHSRNACPAGNAVPPTRSPGPTSIGGPPIALLYQHHDPAQIRSTLAVYFLAGAAFSLVGLGISGQLEASTFWLAVALLPCLVAGFGLSRALHRVVPRHQLRTGVLLVCALSSTVLLVRSALG